MAIEWLTPILKGIGDARVADILREKVGLLELQRDDAFRKASEAEAKIKLLEAKLLVAEALSNDLQAKLKALAPKSDALDATSEKVLQAFFDAEDDVSAESVARRLGLPKSDIKYHFDILKERKFIHQTRVGFQGYGGSSPPGYGITKGGRAYIMERR